MVTYAAPGAYVNERLLNLETPDVTADASAYGTFVGQLNRGPAVPTMCRSWSDFKGVFGGFDGNLALPFAVYSYFQNGGRSALVQRVLGTGAVSASRALTDVGTGAAVTLTANSEGLWGNAVTVDVVASDTPGRFSVYVYLSGVQIERFMECSMDAADRRYFVAVVNGQSTLLTAVAGASVSVGAQKALTPQRATALTGGANGAAPTGTQLLAVRSKLEEVEAPLVLNLPGVTDASTLSAYLGWAEVLGTVFVVVDAPLNATPDAALDFADTLLPTAVIDGFASTLTPTSHGAIYYPGLVVADPSSAVPGATRTIHPGGAMVGQYAATDATEGVFRAPAGLNNQIIGAVALERRLSDVERGKLNTAAVPVNPLRVIPGGGIVPYGARTMKAGQADKYVPVRRTLIYLRNALLDITRFAVFETNDSDLWESVREAVSSFLQEFYQQGGLRGATPDQAFYVKCDGSLNGRPQIENGEVRVEVGVSLQYPAEFIVISLGQFEGGATIIDNANTGA